jgi:type IV secretion system protein VirD4
MSPDIMVKDNQTFIGSKSLDLLTGGSIFVIGSPGSGKSINIILPSILASLEDPAKPSLVVTDPKNELYSSSAAFALKNGYRVIKFDLSKPESSDH